MMRLRLGLLNEDLAERFGVSRTVLLIYIYNMDQTFKQSIGQSLGCMAFKRIHKRTFILNIPQVWLWEMSCNHRLCRGVY